MSNINFPYYSAEELNEIKLFGLKPEDMTVPYNCEHIQDKRIKQFLRNDNQVFVISTQFKQPKYHFKVSQEIDIDSLYFPETRAICLGHIKRVNKGIRVISYFFQFI